MRSHELAIAAIDDGRMAEEIVPVTSARARREAIVEQDEAPRRDTTLEALAKLPPIFVADGTHTAGNSPGVNDGAGAIVVASESWAKANGKEPLADDRRATPRPPTSSPTSRARRRSPPARRWRRPASRPSEIDLWEINEAFASVTLQLDPDARDRRGPRQRQRRRGRARPPDRRVRRAHPRSLVHELRRRGGGLGCAAICSGGAQGDAVIVRV